MLSLTRSDYILAAVCVFALVVCGGTAALMLTVNSIKANLRDDPVSYCLLMLSLALAGIAIKGIN